MKLIKDKVFIRITKDQKDSIFSKEIVRDDGIKVKLWTNVEAGDNDDRRATLFVQTGIVEAVAPNMAEIKVGDTAILDYRLCNMDDHIVYKDGEDIVYWLEARTTYHEDTLIAHASQKNPRDQIAYTKGDYENLSMLLGVFRGDKIYAREPFVFLEHESNNVSKVSPSGILYSETKNTYQRKVIASSPESQKNYGIHPGSAILVHDFDVFGVSFGGRQFDCICDGDSFALHL